MHIRFPKAIKSNINSDNEILNPCARLCLEGSISDTGTSLTYICSKYGLTKKMHMGYVQEHFFIKNVALAGIHTLPQEAVCAGVAIREAIDMREHNYGQPRTTNNINKNNYITGGYINT